MNWSRFPAFVLETISLRTARARLLSLSLVSVLVFVLPIRMLAHLSLWGHLGIHAPSIGLTRAYHYLLHGNIALASHQNPLIFVILLIGVPLIIKDMYTVLIQLNRGKPNARTTN
jgi:hypothetical protein